jgi:hypothetical protein
MKLSRVVDWKVLVGSLIASIVLALGLQMLSGFGFWASWGMILVVWLGVGISTLVDDE